MYWIPGKYLRFREKGGEEREGRRWEREREGIRREGENKAGLRRALKAKGSEEALAPEIRTF